MLEILEENSMTLCQSGQIIQSLGKLQVQSLCQYQLTSMTYLFIGCLPFLEVPLSL
jgi:hypothetical protein